MLTFGSRIRAHALNGASVALGIGVLQLAFGLFVGAPGAQLALSGAVCTSLADVPNTVPRTWYRVTAAALLSGLAALTVAALRAHPALLGGGIALIGFVAMLCMAWGPRAGAVAFAPILALVFAMAVPPEPLVVVALWHAAGSVAYLAWSLASGALLQWRYRRLALAEALQAEAVLLATRAALLEAPRDGHADALAMQAWISGEAALAERLQTARDFVFAAPETARAQRDSAVLLRAIDLRDVLLASRLDLELLGSDTPGRLALQRVGAALRQIGDALDAAAQAQRAGRAPAPLDAAAFDFRELFVSVEMAEDDPRTALLPAVNDRLLRIAGEVLRIHALLAGARAESPLSRAELQRFVAPEGWPLEALSDELRGHSPVLRHALRTALALGCAYAIGRLLPWASHPHWLVLSVAVVLRGNLEQTLSRRNARVGGTLLGCLIVVGLAGLHSPLLLGVTFLVAVGTAHAFVLQRYWLTAAAATVMALLQSHGANPAAGFAVGERVADTLLGAALAWAFSYVLPAWERRSLPTAVDRVLKALADYAGRALARASADPVEQRLARRRAYDALGALAATLQRSAAEPSAVRLPVREVAALLDRGQRLMAHLSLVRMTLSRRDAELAGAPVTEALDATRAALSAALALQPPAASAPAEADPPDLALLPTQPPSADVMPWLLRRLRVMQQDAQEIRVAALTALAEVGRSAGH